MFVSCLLLCSFLQQLPMTSEGALPDGQVKSDSEATDGIEEIQIVGQRRVPGSLLSRSHLDLEDGIENREFFARTIGDQLDQVPGVHLQRTSYGQVSPFLRGLTGFRTLALIDGIRLNNSTFRSGPNQYVSLIDPLLLDSTKIIFGPGSVLHGSDAAGGVIQMSSRIPRPGDQSGEESRFFQRLSSAEQSSISRIEYESISEETAFGFGASLKSYGDFYAGAEEGLQEETGYGETSANFSVVHELQDHLTLQFVAQSHRQNDVPRTHSTIYGSTWEGLVTGSDLKRNLDGERDLVYLRMMQWHGPQSSSRWTISRQDITDAEDRVRSNGVLREQGVATEAMGVAYDWFGYSELGPLSTGLEWTHEEVDSYFRQYDSLGNLDVVRPRGPVANDSTYDWLGAYVQQVVPVTPITRLNLGVRASWAQVDAKQVDPDPSDTEDFGPVKEDWNSLVGSIRAIHKGSDSMEIFGGLSQAFRAPNLSDLTRFDAASSGDAEIPATDLDPERFLTGELGARYKRENQELETVLWYSWLDGLIVRFPTGDVNSDGDTIVTKKNSGDGFANGIDIRYVNLISTDWTLSGSASWITGDLDTPVSPGVSETEPLSRLAPAMVRIALKKQFSNQMELLGVLTAADRQDRLSPRDLADDQRIPVGGTPGYVVLDLHATYPWKPNMEIFGSLTNLTNQDYRIHGSGTNEPGFNLIFGVDTQF
ncbi:MAG: TonB-dependent receptor [Proteobacteria bacterium]|nr:TonB-dependent receptor [Pseudomonadota bacterium]